MTAVETLGSKQVYANPWMTVREDAIRRPDGSTGIYGVVESPDIAPSMFSLQCRVFLATDLTHGAPERELEEQDMRSAWFTRADVERMISDGTITDAKSTAAYALLLLQAQTSAHE